MLLTTLAHETITHHIFPGATAVDATAGNGYDTVFLAQQVGAQGRVFAFDIQADAIAQTAARLETLGLGGRVSLHHADHAGLATTLTDADIRAIDCAMFNLGYLPGADKTCITRPAHTLAALTGARAMLRSGGVITVLAYRGHAGGVEEADAVCGWMRAAEAQGGEVSAYDSAGPILWVLRAISA